MTLQTEIGTPSKPTMRKAAKAIALTKANAPPKAGSDDAANRGKPTEGRFPEVHLAADAVSKTCSVEAGPHKSQAEANGFAAAKPSEECSAGSAPDVDFTTDITQSDTTATLKAGRFAQLLTLLSQGRAIPLAEITTAFGWQPHSARAAPSGLRKAGHKIEARKLETGGSADVLTKAAKPVEGAKP